jgi:alpha-galactosidase
VVSELVKNTGRCSFSPNPDVDNQFSLDVVPSEYPSYGNTDLRMPAYQIQLENGTRITDLSFQSYDIIQGKNKLTGLPSLTAGEEDAQTLYITLTDKLIQMKVILAYTVFEKEDVIVRSARFMNEGTQKLRILRALSMSIDFDHYNYDLLSLSGSWARERHMIRRPLNHGTQSIESRRGASGHAENPFLALMEKNATENSGEVYGFNLVYSGNFIAYADVDQYSTTRVAMGINPFDFSWCLLGRGVYHS